MSGFVKCQCGGWKYYRSKLCWNCRWPADKPTQAELDVLKPYAEGKNRKQVASDLGISVKAVEDRLARLKSRLRIYDNILLTHWALANNVAKLQV